MTKKNVENQFSPMAVLFGKVFVVAYILNYLFSEMINRLTGLGDWTPTNWPLLDGLFQSLVMSGIVYGVALLALRGD